MLSAIKTKYPRLILHKLKSTREYYYIANWFTKDNSFQRGKHETIENFTPRQLAMVSLSWLPQPGVSEIPWLFPDKCKISPTNWINNFTHQTWWWTQPSPRNHLLHIFIYAFSKSGAVYIRVFSCIWKYRMWRFSWQTHAEATCWVPESKTSRRIRGAHILIFTNWTL